MTESHSASSLTSSYQRYHRDYIKRLCNLIRQTPPFVQFAPSLQDGGADNELQAEFLEKLTILENQEYPHEMLAETGQWLISAIVSAYPHITPHIPRDLFWYFGGDCLHYLGDEEITYFQAIDEAFHLAQNNPTDDNKDYEHIVRHVAGQSNNFH